MPLRRERTRSETKLDWADEVEQAIPSLLDSAKKKNKGDKKKEGDGEPAAKKKKKEKKAVVDPSAKVEEEVKEKGAFRKIFYKPTEATLNMPKKDMLEFQEKHKMNLTGRLAEIYKPIQDFDDYSTDPKIMSVVKDFLKPTAIQSQCWPIISSGRDIIGIAETGSGKTLAFSLPALPHILHRYDNPVPGLPAGPIMLVLSPTRELAMQSQVVLEEAGKASEIRSVCCYGGVPKWQQKQSLRWGVEAVVATPGRLKDLVQMGCLNLRGVSYLVLDEADRMLDQGFERDIRQIVGETHKGRQTALFSATWPDSVRQLAHSFLNRPIKVTIGSEDLAAGTRITQIVEVVEDRAREGMLVKLLNKYHSSRKNRVLIFVLYKKEAARVEQTLKRSGWNACSIHGDKSQDQRTLAVEQFKSGEVPLLVATDVAARGLDIPGVDFVINYSFPLTIEDYVHRIGRTGRAGREGTSHTFFQTCDKLRAGELVKVLKDANQEVPESMNDFDLCIKKKEHKLYGAFGPKDHLGPMKKATKITFD